MHARRIAFRTVNPRMREQVPGVVFLLILAALMAGPAQAADCGQSTPRGYPERH
jgi:hypothetical protein